jgi:hypothetical protein
VRTPVYRGRLKRDVEIRDAERSGQAVPGRLFRVIDGRELIRLFFTAN